MWLRRRIRAGTRNGRRGRRRRRGVRSEHPRSRAGSRDGRRPSRSLRGRDRCGRDRSGRVTLLARSLYRSMERRPRHSGRLRPRRRRHARPTRFPRGLRRGSRTGRGLRRGSRTGRGLRRGSRTGRGLRRGSRTGRGLRRGSRTGRGLRRGSRTGRGQSGSGRRRRCRRDAGGGTPCEAGDRLDRRHRGEDVAHRAPGVVPRPARLDILLESRDVPRRRRRRPQVAPRRGGLGHDGLPLSGLQLAQGSLLLGTLRLAPSSALAVDLLAHRLLNSGTAGASRCTEPRRRARGTRPVLRPGPARGSPLTRWPMPGSRPG